MRPNLRATCGARADGCERARAGAVGAERERVRACDMCVWNEVSVFIS